MRRSFFKVKLKQYVSIQQWFENKGQQLPYYSCIFDQKTSDSCSWTIHKDNYLIFGGAFEKKNCKEAFAEGGNTERILKLYKKKTLKLRLKLCFKNPKRFVICNPILRNLVMKSGIQSVEKY